MKIDTDTNLKPAGGNTPRESVLGGNQPPAAEETFGTVCLCTSVAPMIPLVPVIIQSTWDLKLVLGAFLFGFEGAVTLLFWAHKHLEKTGTKVSAASTSALEPCVPESIAPRSSAEASRALERCPNPSGPSPEPQPVAREKCRGCGGTGNTWMIYNYRPVASHFFCPTCRGTGLRTPARGSEQGSNNTLDLTTK